MTEASKRYSDMRSERNRSHPRYWHPVGPNVFGFNTSGPKSPRRISGNIWVDGKTGNIQIGGTEGITTWTDLITGCTLDELITLGEVFLLAAQHMQELADGAEEE